MTENQFGEKTKPESRATHSPLLITTHTAPPDAAALRHALRQSPHGIALLDAKGLHAESLQRAQSRFFDFYDLCRKIAQDSGREAIFLCPCSLSTPPFSDSGMQHLRFSQNLLFSHLTALLRISASICIAPILPCTDSRTQLLAMRALAEEAMSVLYAQDIPFDETLPMGISPLLPQALLAVDTLLEEADFLMIDTDLPWSGETQDLLHLWEVGIGNAHLLGRFVVICGQTALQPSLLPHLLAMGADAVCLPLSRQKDFLDKSRLFFRGIT